MNNFIKSNLINWYELTNSQLEILGDIPEVIQKYNYKYLATLEISDGSILEFFCSNIAKVRKYDRIVSKEKCSIVRAHFLEFATVPDDVIETAQEVGAHKIPKNSSLFTDTKKRVEELRSSSLKRWFSITEDCEAYYIRDFSGLRFLLSPELREKLES